MRGHNILNYVVKKEAIKVYKQIEIDLDRSANEVEKEAIIKINDSFSEDDLYIETDRNKIIFNLRLIDLDKFKERVDKLVSENNLNSKNLFNDIVNKIEDIKSYGLKSGKRLYVDYDKERKVKGRKQKS